MLTVGGTTLPVPAALASWDGKPVLAGVRAEHIAVAGRGSEATVEVAEPTGATVLLTVRWAGHELNVSTGPGFTAWPGDPVRLRIPPESLRFFDPETGMALSR